MIVSKEMLKLMGWCIKLDRAEVAVAISLVLNSNFSCTYQNLSELNHIKSVNLRYITVGRLDDDMIVPLSDGPMFILINWE